jgi:hypothetical protein
MPTHKQHLKEIATASGWRQRKKTKDSGLHKADQGRRDKGC